MRGSTNYIFLTGCQKCYARDTYNPIRCMTMHDLYHATVEKTEYLKSEGYNVVEIWECAINRELTNDEEMKYYFDYYDMTDPLEPRDALYGGRTNASKLYHECEADEQIR